MSSASEETPDSPSDTRTAVMNAAQAVAGEIPTPMLRSLICPFCGSATPDTGRCRACSARFDPLSRQATQNQMGPWNIRDEQFPFRPGCTYETMVRLIGQGVVRADTVIRGPTTRQFWTLAKHTPSIAQKLGMCHNCQHEVEKESFMCPSCQASFSPERDRQHMGLGPLRPLPGQGNPQVLAMQAEPGVGAPGSAETMLPQNGGAGARQAMKPEEAVDAIRQWRRAFDAERKRAWIAVGLAGLVTLIAVATGMMGFQRTAEPVDSSASRVE